MKTAHFLRKDITTSQDLSLGALSYTTSIGRAFKLERILVKFSQAVTETITITLDSKNGASYDVVLRERSLSAETSFVYEPQGEENYQAGDEIKIQCTNANLVGVCYSTIKTSEL